MIRRGKCENCGCDVFSGERGPVPSVCRKPSCLESRRERPRKKCEFCYRSFEVRHKNQKYCCRRCSGLDGKHSVVFFLKCKNAECESIFCSHIKTKSFCSTKCHSDAVRSKDCFCLHCGAIIVRNTGKKDAKKYCTKDCYFAAVRAGTQQFKGTRVRSLASKKESRCTVCMKEMTKPAVINGTVCIECRESHKAKQESALREKQSRTSWKKRCEKHGGNFNPDCKREDIYERDNYRCHVCRKKVLGHAVIGHPMSPTVDHHPVPLSKGGDHDWHNVRCCCRQCNVRKNNQWDGQMALPISFAN